MSSSFVPRARQFANWKHEIRDIHGSFRERNLLNTTLERRARILIGGRVARSDRLPGDFMMTARDSLFDAIPEDDEEITARHQPDPALLNRTRQRATRSESGLSPIPPPLPRRAKLVLVPVERLRSLLEHYTSYAGPAARPILLAQLQQLGATPETFPQAQSSQLIALLGARLDSFETRQKFISEARHILQE